VLLVVGGVIAGLIVLGSLTPDTSTTPDQATQSTTAAAGQEPADTTAARPPATKAATLGTPIRDGKFEFTVKRIRCGIQRIGSTYFNKRAQGQFCLVTTHVSNIGDEAQTLDASNQYLFDRAGRRYETSDANAFLEGSKTFLEEINPGNAVDGTLVFDVPKGFAPSKIELHDSAFSGGVHVAL